MVDTAREQKVQELLRVSRALANKHEIGLCFNERMIRGGIDTLTVEDLEQAYEVFAANTVEISVCTDSVIANSNGLKLSRSSRMAREAVELRPGQGGTLLAEYMLIWTHRNNRAAVNYDYSGQLRMRIDWGYSINECVPYFIPNYPQVGGIPIVCFPLNYTIYIDPLDDNGYYNEGEYYENLNPFLVFEGECEFEIQMAEGVGCHFVVWAKDCSSMRVMKLTLTDYDSNLLGDFTLSDNGIIIPA